MYRGAGLASTGVGVVILGMNVQMGWLIGAAVTLVMMGCIAYRLGTRSKRINAG